MTGFYLILISFRVWKLFFYDFGRLSYLQVYFPGFSLVHWFQCFFTLVIQNFPGKKQPPKPRFCQKLEKSIFEFEYFSNSKFNRKKPPKLEKIKISILKNCPVYRHFEAGKELIWAIPGSIFLKTGQILSHLTEIWRKSSFFKPNTWLRSLVLLGYVFKSSVFVFCWAGVLGGIGKINIDIL